MEILDLEPGDVRLSRDVLPVLQQLRPHLTQELFGEVYANGYAQGLRFSAMYDGNNCVGVAGWRIVHNTDLVRKMYVDDLVTTETARSSGVGHDMLAYLEQRARQLGCRAIDLDTGVQRSSAQRFYFREQLAIVSFHFGKLLT